MPIVAGVVCEKCGKTELWEHAPKRDVRQFARDRRWIFGKQILCPACADVVGTRKERRTAV